MFDINPGLILWTIITFVIVLVILRLTAWKTLVGALTSREEKIRTSLEQAERAQQDAVRLLEENKKQLAQAEEHSQRIIRDGRDLGEQLKTEILEKADTGARHMIEQAKDEIAREKEKALNQLRAEVAELAIGVAGKILDANLDPAKHRQLIDAAIKDLSKG
jgi:F-type H+-transporting ATPase subunit b